MFIILAKKPITESSMAIIMVMVTPPFCAVFTKGVWGNFYHFQFALLDDKANSKLGLLLKEIISRMVNPNRE